jgi:hypothetical protein
MAFLGYMTQVTSLPDRTARSICSGLNCTPRCRYILSHPWVQSRADACSSAAANLAQREPHLDVGIDKQDVCIGRLG